MPAASAIAISTARSLAPPTRTAWPSWPAWTPAAPTRTLYQAHPDWFARDDEGKPYRAGEHFITCVNSPYYEEYLPGILREIIERSHPEGITDNSWSGLDRSRICHCEHCQQAIPRAHGQAAAERHDWNDAVYRAWIEWSYETGWPSGTGTTA